MLNLKNEGTQGGSDRNRSFGPFRLSLSEQTLFKDDQRLPLGSRALSVLLALTDRPGELMTNAELLAKVWPDVHVEGAALRVHISTLQKVLGSRPSGGRFIANVAGRGYRFIGPLADSGSTPVCLTSAPTSSNGELPRNGSIRVVGRELAVQTLVENLPARRFITITGPGGIGKTTVALAVAMQLASEYRDGVRFIDLTTLPNSGLVLPKVASELQLHGSSFQSESDLAAYLQGRQMLLVLDNCEHLVEAVALLAERVNAAAPCVHILTTSREPLRAVGEWVHRLPPLDLPPPTTFSNAAEVLSAPSVILFVERAKAANDGFGLAQADLPSVVEICRRVDGIPLAIELAAARVDLLGVQVLARLLGESFSLLAGGRRTALPRQRTMRATLDWSYSLLSEDERALLCGLAAFRGSFTLDAARAVIGVRSNTGSLLDGMAALAGKSLILVVRQSDKMHYRLLETTRIYAFEKLNDSGHLDAVLRKHAYYFCDLLEHAETDLAEETEQSWMAAYSHSLADVRAAIDWLLKDDNHQNQGICLASKSATVWFVHGLMEDYRGLAERALQSTVDDFDKELPIAKMRLETWLAAATFATVGPVPQVEASFRRALTFAVSLEEPEYQLHALWGLITYHNARGDTDEALKACQHFNGVVEHYEQWDHRAMRDRVMAGGLCLIGQSVLGIFAEARVLAERRLWAPLGK